MVFLEKILIQGQASTSRAIYFFTVPEDHEFHSIIDPHSLFGVLSLVINTSFL